MYWQSIYGETRRQKFIKLRIQEEIPEGDRWNFDRSPTEALMLPRWVTERVSVCLHNRLTRIASSILVKSIYVQWREIKRLGYSKLPGVLFFLHFPRGKELEMAKTNGNKLKSPIISSVACFKRKLGPVWKGIKGGAKKEMEDYFYYFSREINDIKKNLPSPSRQVLVKCSYCLKCRVRSASSICSI